MIIKFETVTFRDAIANFKDFQEKVNAKKNWSGKKREAVRQRVLYYWQQ